jgi:hypothetical protein
MTMNKEESDQIYELCSRIAVEQDHKKFSALVGQLNRILAAQDQRLQSNNPKESGLTE